MIKSGKIFLEILLFSALCLLVRKREQPVILALWPHSLIVGYSAKEQANTAPTGIITFQWDACSGENVYLNGFIKPSVAGTAYNHGANDEFTPGWELMAPKIQVRRTDGGYTVRYYADDMWDDALCTEANGYDPDGDGIAGIAGWGDNTGVYDATTTLSLGGGAWVSCAGSDCTFTTAGAVASEATAVGGDSTITMLCGGAFPIAFQLNDTNTVVWTCSPGTAYNHGENDEFTTGWELTAPKIQVRRADGGYTVRYYADDMWDDALCTEANGYDPDGDGIAGIAGWGDNTGVYDPTTSVEVGGGFWLNQPNGDKRIFVTVKNPIK